MEESAPQIVTSNLQNRKLRPERLNLDKVGAIRDSFFSILVIALFPCLIRMGSTFIELLYPLRPGGMFLVFFAGAVAFSWQLASSGSLVVKYLRGERGNPSQHIAFGLSALPKVLLSHSILILLLFFLFPASGDGSDFPTFLRSMLLVIVSVGFFLSWAPAFVAGEFFAKPLPQVEDDMEDFDSVKLTFLKPKFFSGMGIFDLGIERSFYFCINNFSLTVMLLLLGCCVRVIPAALGIVIFGHSTSFGAAATECILSSVGVGVLMIGIGLTFIGSLPKEARAELELLDDSVIALPVGAVSKSRFLARIALGIVVAASVLATYFLIQTIKVEQSFPEALVPKYFDVERTQSTTTIKFEIEDKTTAYRWLDAERFRLQVPKPPEEVSTVKETPEKVLSDEKAKMEPKKGGVLEVLQNKLGDQAEDKNSPAAPAKEEMAVNVPNFNLLAPSEVLFYSDKGELIDERFFKPYFGKIKITLTFDYGTKSAAAEQDFNLESSINPRSRDEKLIYLLIDQSAQVLATLPSEQSSKE